MRKYGRYRMFPKGDYMNKERDCMNKESLGSSPRAHAHTEQIKLVLPPIYQQAAEAAHGQAARIADAGGSYASADDGRNILVDEGYVGVKISFEEPEMFTQFWREVERLQQG